MSYCDRCERSFGSNRALWQHKQDSSNHHICDDCDRDFASRQRLLQHYVDSSGHHYCKDCSEDFDNEDDLETHYEEEHTYCRRCGIVSEPGFDGPNNLGLASPPQMFDAEYELQEHKSDSDKHNICNSCDKDFATRWALIQHYVQSPRHDYCQRCDEHLLSEEELKSHYDDAHHRCHDCNRVRCPQIGLDPLICFFLQFFKNQRGLDEHDRQVHSFCIPCRRYFQSDHSREQHLSNSSAHN